MNGRACGTQFTQLRAEIDQTVTATDDDAAGGSDGE